MTGKEEWFVFYKIYLKNFRNHRQVWAAVRPMTLYDEASLI